MKRSAPFHSTFLLPLGWLKAFAGEFCADGFLWSDSFLLLHVMSVREHPQRNSQEASLASPPCPVVLCLVWRPD